MQQIHEDQEGRVFPALFFDIQLTTKSDCRYP